VEFAIFLILFIVLYLVGMPVAFSMMISSVTYALINGFELAFFSLEAFKSLNSFALTAIPMFMLTAEIMGNSTVADRMFDFLQCPCGMDTGRACAY
jgi:TRAP-type mannitol/chloroaromatic compound transport system permease large subunit